MSNPTCNRKKWVQEYLDKQIALYQSLGAEDILPLVDLMRDAVQKKRTIFVVGNGGSAANAQHFVEDLGKGASDALCNYGLHAATGIKPRFRVLSLCDSVPYITAIGNDIDYESIFSKQLENLAQEGDILIGISVSGTSPNIVKAFEVAGEKGMHRVALVGEQARRRLALGNGILHLCEHSVVFQDTHFGRVEDAQMTLLHMICYYFIDSFKEGHGA